MVTVAQRKTPFLDNKPAYLSRYLFSKSILEGPNFIRVFIVLAQDDLDGFGGRLSV